VFDWISSRGIEGGGTRFSNRVLAVVSLDGFQYDIAEKSSEEQTN
jgi:hypothetical protein